MIVKVQRPLATNDPSAPWLIYDEARSFYQMVPEAEVPASVKEAMGDDAKGYFNAVDKGAELNIRERVGAQDW